MIDECAQNLKISFDFDGTLACNDFVYLIAQALKMRGHHICILTSRDTNWDNRDLIARIEPLGLSLDKDVIWAPNTWKWQKMKEHKINCHFDDDPKEINLINKHCESIFHTAGFLVSFDIPFTLELLTQKHFKDGC